MNLETQNIFKMNYYIDNNITFDENSIIEYTVTLFGGSKVKCFVGLSKKPEHKGKYTFLDENKEDTIFENACRFNSLDEVINFIKSDIRSDIERGKLPSPLIINNKVVSVFNEILM